MTSKADYVRSQGQTRDHTCHWPGCAEQVPPARWGCRKHWFMLPENIRTMIWRAFVPGQEVTMTPSASYIEAARVAQEWIEGYLKTRRDVRGAGSAQLGDKQGRSCSSCGLKHGDKTDKGYVQLQLKPGPRVVSDAGRGTVGICNFCQAKALRAKLAKEGGRDGG